MDVYDKGLEERMAEWEVKKYKSHRRSPANFLNKSSNLTSYRFQFFRGLILIYYYPLKTGGHLQANLPAIFDPPFLTMSLWHSH